MLGMKSLIHHPIDTLRVAPGAQRIVLTYSNTKLVGRSLAASTSNVSETTNLTSPGIIPSQEKMHLQLMQLRQSSVCTSLMAGPRPPSAPVRAGLEQ
jgi:hypothetical protein